MSKSAIYLVNNTKEEVIKDGSIIPLGTIFRRFGQNIRQDGNSISICDKCTGYYKVTIMLTLEVAAVGDYKVTLEKDGTPVIGAVAELDGIPALTIAPFPISAIIKNTCGGHSNLSIRLVGGDAKIINLSTVVERL